MAKMKSNLDLPKDDMESLAHDSGWDSTSVSDLAKLLSDCLHTCVDTAIKQIVANGYSKEVAEQTVLKCGPFYGVKDFVSLITDVALDYLKKEVRHDATWYEFEDLNRLVEFMMLEMVTMLRDIKPSLSVREAMWTLLICDLNIIDASQAELDPQKFSIGGLKSGQGAGPSAEPESLLEPKTEAEPKTVPEHDSKSAGKKVDEKCQCCTKCCTGHKKAVRFERNYSGRMSKKALKANLTSWKKLNLSIEKVQSACESSSSVNNKNPTLPLKETNSEPVPQEPLKTTEYYLSGIPFDEAKGEHVAQDDKDELILTAVRQVQSLQKELKDWDDWANVKVMQVAKRLSYDRPELTKLKAEKAEDERLMKKLSETTAALNTYSSQLQLSSQSIVRLEYENSVLKQEREKAENKNLNEAQRLKEALLKEQEAMRKCELFGPEKIELEEELRSLKREVGPKQHDLEKAKGLLTETEIRLAKEKKETAKFRAQAESIKTEREHLEALAKAEEQITAEKAENEQKKYECEIKRIQSEIAAIKLEAETKKIAAMRKEMSWQPAEQTSSRSEVKHGSNKKDRECVMCLTEEMTVVFVPCGHQVLCAECNVLHEKNGMKDCPSCRTQIQKRITARFAKS
ncbi:putative E3 ubiquitin-protein ligase RF298 [Tanacetum coccineum]|uniref:E3 ubiquitin-protein ligase RF298 n=1 Tax=Tanacetum coccineum TaxID=301880 RepID=A0ABQ4ZSU8_9ASTR